MHGDGTPRRIRGRWHTLVTLSALLAAPAAAQGPAPGAALTLPDVVALALRNNPETRVSHARAEAASAMYGVVRGSWYPSVSVSAPLTRSRSVTGGSSLSGVERTQFTPGVSLSYLLFDFGGRSGGIDQARATAVAASQQDDATVQATVLRAEEAYFAFNIARDLAVAREANERMAAEARDAALQRWRVGLATVADTLQASTALAQARLAVLTSRGDVRTARGALASAMGISATTPFEIAPAAAPAAVETVTASVDSLMARAVRERPELAGARAEAAAAEAGVRVARAAGLPSLTLGGSAGRSLSDLPQLEGNSYGLSLGVEVPVFAGFSRRYGIRAARQEAEAARALADVTRVEIANQVYTSYAALQVSAARVAAASQLLASAALSEEVARGRYQEGIGDIIDLITAQNALAAARAEEAESRWAWQTALARLAFDVGTLDRRGAPGLDLSATPATTPRTPAAPR